MREEQESNITYDEKISLAYVCNPLNSAFQPVKQYVHVRMTTAIN